MSGNAREEATFVAVWAVWRRSFEFEKREWAESYAAAGKQPKRKTQMKMEGNVYGKDAAAAAKLLDQSRQKVARGS